MKLFVNLAVFLVSMALIPIGKVIAVDEGQRFKNGVGVYVYKSIQRFKDHIEPFLELHVGDHYYVQGPFTSTYWNAIGTIDLSTLFMNLASTNGKKGTACLSLGVLTGKGTVDIGIENAGNGWFPFWYTMTWDKSSGTPRNTYPTAKKISSVDAKIEGTQDKEYGYFNFYDRNNALLGSEALVFSVPKGTFFAVNSSGQPILRFVRFMSLLPAGGDNTAATDVRDYSYMRNAKFTGLQLYDRTRGYVPWNMDRIEYAWSVQTANIQNLQISASNKNQDLFSAYHSV